jgi:hypothetical protein
VERRYRAWQQQQSEQQQQKQTQTHKQTQNSQQQEEVQKADPPLFSKQAPEPQPKETFYDEDGALVVTDFMALTDFLVGEIVGDSWDTATYQEAIEADALYAALRTPEREGGASWEDRTGGGLAGLGRKECALGPLECSRKKHVGWSGP